MAHGAGGKATQGLIEGLLVPAFASPALDALGDAGVVGGRRRELALTTDSFVVTPIRFPGGSIGELAVNGTVNDLAVAGARPLALTLSLVLEEGLAAGRAARRGRGDRAAPREPPGVQIVAGDTKVVERGHADGMYVCTTGLGLRDPRARLSPARAAARRPASCSRAGSATTARRSCSRAASSSSGADDRVRHAPAVARGRRAARRRRPGLRCLRDATRGGVASVLNELARAPASRSSCARRDVPVHPAVAGAAELLGIDPMYVANEGKLVAFVAPEAAEAALAALRAVPGRRARRPRSARSRRSRPAWCWSRPRSAGGG